MAAYFLAVAFVEEGKYAEAIEQFRRIGCQQRCHLGRQVFAQQRRGHAGLVHQRPEKGVVSYW